MLIRIQARKLSDRNPGTSGVTQIDGAPTRGPTDSVRKNSIGGPFGAQNSPGPPRNAYPAGPSVTPLHLMWISAKYTCVSGKEILLEENLDMKALNIEENIFFTFIDESNRL